MDHFILLFTFFKFSNHKKIGSFNGIAKRTKVVIKDALVSGHKICKIYFSKG